MAPYQLGNINARPLATLFHVKPEARCFGSYLPEQYDIICMWLPQQSGVEKQTALGNFVMVWSLKPHSLAKTISGLYSCHQMQRFSLFSSYPAFRITGRAIHGVSQSRIPPEYHQPADDEVIVMRRHAGEMGNIHLATRFDTCHGGC